MRWLPRLQRRSSRQPSRSSRQGPSSAHLRRAVDAPGLAALCRPWVVNRGRRSRRTQRGRRELLAQRGLIRWWWPVPSSEAKVPAAARTVSRSLSRRCCSTDTTRDGSAAIRRASATARPSPAGTTDLRVGGGLGSTHDRLTRMPSAVATWNVEYAAGADRIARRCQLLQAAAADVGEFMETTTSSTCWARRRTRPCSARAPFRALAGRGFVASMLTPGLPMRHALGAPQQPASSWRRKQPPGSAARPFPRRSPQ